MRYLSLAEALVIAEAVTGLDASTLLRVCQVDLLDSALHAPQAGFGDVDFYPGFVEKAAVLVARIVGNHPLPDGNKRLAWQALTMFFLSTAACSASAARTAHSASSSWATGSPKTASTASPISLSIRPPYFCTIASASVYTPPISSRTTSGSSCSAISVYPDASENNTVMCRRSSRAAGLSPFDGSAPNGAAH